MQSCCKAATKRYPVSSPRTRLHLSHQEVHFDVHLLFLPALQLAQLQVVLPARKLLRKRTKKQTRSAVYLPRNFVTKCICCTAILLHVTVNLLINQLVRIWPEMLAKLLTKPLYVSSSGNHHGRWRFKKSKSCDAKGRILVGGLPLFNNDRKLARWFAASQQDLRKQLNQHVRVIGRVVIHLHRPLPAMKATSTKA